MYCKGMKARVLSLFLLALFCFGTALAQIDTGMRYGLIIADRRSPGAKKLLTITPKQEQALTKIDKSYIPKMRAVFKAHQGEPPNMENLYPVMAAHGNALLAVLSPKQRALLKKWVDTHPAGTGL